MGIDAFLEIETWKNVTRLMNTCNFAVISRGDFDCSDLWDTITKYLSDKFRNLRFHYRKIEPESRLTCIQAKTSPYFIIPIKTKPVDISSTKIRENIKYGKSIHGLVPEKVNIYIEKNKLYR